MSTALTVSIEDDEVKRRLRKACLICRRLKMRCLPSDGDFRSDAPCARCKRRQLVCEYAKKRRPVGMSPEAHDFDNPSFPTEVLAPPIHWHTSGLSPPIISGSSTHLESLNPTLVPSVSIDSLLLDGSSERLEVSPTSMVHHLEPNVGVEDSRPPSPRPFARAINGSAHPIETPVSANDPMDPVSLGLLTEVEARFLTRYFLTRMCEISHLFDPVYHTFERLRHTPELFSAVLGVAARFRRSDLVDQLLAHADRLVMRSVCSGDVTLATVHALLVLVHWKHPDDRSAYMKMGMAVRAASQLRLGSTVGSPLPKDETEARERLAGDRIWLALFGYEMATSELFRLPTLLNPTTRPPATEVRDWLDRHRHLNLPGDLHLSITYSILELVPAAGMKLYEEYPGRAAEQDMEPLVTAAYSRWLDDEQLVGVQRCVVLYARSWMIVNLRYRVVRGSPDRASKERLLSGIDGCRRLAMQLAQMGHLSFLSDVSIVSFVLPGCMLFELRQMFNEEELEVVRTILAGFIDVASEYSDTYPGHALTHMSRTYRKLSKAFKKVPSGLTSNEQPQIWSGNDTIPIWPAESGVDEPHTEAFWALLSESFPVLDSMQQTVPQSREGLDQFWMI